MSLAEESSCSFESDNETSSSIDIDDFLGPPTPVGCTHLLTYKLVGDNIDKNVRPRDMQSDHQTRSLHYFHTYAVCDRVDISHFSNETSILNVGTIQLDNLLPTNHDQHSLSLETLRYLWMHTMQIFLFLRSLVMWRGIAIQHKFSKEISKMSEVVSQFEFSIYQSVI